MATRPKLTPKILPSREEMFPADVQALMLEPRFRRFMLTVLETAGMFTGSFHSEAGASQWYEGRRSLGFDMLHWLKQHAGHDALIRILGEDQPTEANHGRRNSSDRNRELDDGEPVADRGRADRDEQFLDYGSRSD